MRSRLRQLVADPATGYVLRAGAWFLFLLAALRLPWIQNQLLVPFAALQGRAAAALMGEDRLRVLVDTSCSGSDAIAVCLGAVIAFPTSWKRRLLAAAGGFGLIAAVNTVRLGHLSAIVSDHERFALFHYKVWPALIVVVAAGYALWWMRSLSVSDAGEARSSGLGATVARQPLLPVLALATVLVGLYYAFYDRLLASPLLEGAARFAAMTAGGLMTACGLPASTSQGVLRTPGATWLVTPECVTTPLIPVFLAVVIGWRRSWPTRLALIAVSPLLFWLLGVLRLMVLALPQALIGSGLVAMHAFYQVLLAAVLVAWLAARGRATGAAPAVFSALGVGALVGVTVGLVDLRAVRPALAGLVETLHLGHGYADPQGVLLILPAFQLALVAALWAAAGRPGGRRGLLTAGALVTAGAAATLICLGELAFHGTLHAPVALLRLWSLVLPAVATWRLGWLETGDRTTRALRQAPSASA